MGTLHEDLRTFMLSPCWIFLKIRNISGKIRTENQDTILYSITFFQMSCRLWRNVQKYGRAKTGHRWQYNTAHALGTLDE
jgi:hypothetical protein